MSVQEDFSLRHNEAFLKDGLVSRHTLQHPRHLSGKSVHQRILANGHNSLWPANGCNAEVILGLTRVFLNEPTYGLEEDDNGETQRAGSISHCS